jgi:hypothetical protein
VRELLHLLQLFPSEAFSADSLNCFAFIPQNIAHRIHLEIVIVPSNLQVSACLYGFWNHNFGGIGSE